MAENNNNHTGMIQKLLKKIADNPTSINAIASIFAVLGGFVVGLIVMLFVNPGDALPGFFTILGGPFRGGMTSLGNTIHFGVPIILTGLSVAFAFRTGLFNIGATGQLTMGAFAAVYIGVNWGFLGPFHWLVAILGAIIAGAIWGAIPGILKATRNVHEVVTSIMLNYVAMYMNTMLITQLIYNQQYARAQTPLRTSFIPKLFMDNIFRGSQVNMAIFLVIGVVILLHIVLNKTTFGYELKSVGFNRDAAKYAGMSEKLNIIYSMIIAGGVAGMAGAMMYLVPGKHLEPVNHLIQEGFDGIAIALLGLSAPFGVLIAGLFYGGLQQGGHYLQLYDFMPEIIDIIIAVIIYFSALSLFLRQFVAGFIKKRIKVDIELQEGSEIA